MTQVKMADAEYFALDRLSFSSLKHILDSPAKFLHQKKFPFRGNEATELGTAIHMWLQNDKDKIAFEPDLSSIKTKEGVLAKNPRMTNEGKALIEEFRASVPKNMVVVPHETKILLEQVETQFRSNPEIQELMSKVNNIEGAYLTEINGLKFKGKLDFEGPGFIVDLKSTGKGADEYSFRRIIRDSHYDLQAAVYLTMKAEQLKCKVEDIPYHIVAIETFPPYEVFPYELSKETIQYGLDKLQTACDLYKTHIISKTPHYHKRKII